MSIVPSNEAFELWFLYHFRNQTTKISRKDYAEAISKAVRNAGKCNYEYDKAGENHYEIMTKCGSMEDAIKFAKMQSENFSDQNYATHNPCTMVFKLVLQLLGQDEKLNLEIS